MLQKLAASIMPLAFLGMHDASGTTKALWQELWDDNTPGMEGGVNLAVCGLRHEPRGIWVFLTRDDGLPARVPREDASDQERCAGWEQPL